MSDNLENYLYSEGDEITVVDLCKQMFGHVPNPNIYTKALPSNNAFKIHCTMGIIITSHGLTKEYTLRPIFSDLCGRYARCFSSQLQHQQLGLMLSRLGV